MEGSSSTLKSLPDETELEREIRTCMEALAKDPQDVELFPKLINLALQYVGMDGSSQRDEDTGKRIGPVAFSFRPHQLCHRCDTDRPQSNMDEQALRFEVQVCMLRGLSFKLKGRIALWVDALAECIFGCRDCYKGLWTARERVGPRFLQTFPQANIDTFIAHTLRWEEDLALQRLERDASPNEHTLFAMLELSGILSAKKESGRLYARLKERRSELDIVALQEMPVGILAMAIDDNEEVRSWACQHSKELGRTKLSDTVLSAVRSLAAEAIRRQLWDSLAIIRKFDPANWSDAELPNTLASLLIDDVEQTRSCLVCLEKHLTRNGQDAWRKEDARYPLVILSSILGSQEYMTSIGAADSDPLLFSWSSAFLESILPDVKSDGAADEETNAAMVRDRSEAFGEALKQIAYFLLERIQQASVPVNGRIAGIERCFTILIARADAFRKQLADVGVDGLPAAVRAPFAAVQQATATHSAMISNVAFRGKIPHAADVLEKAHPIRRLAISFTEKIFEIDCETMVDRMLQLSERVSRHQKTYKRILKESQQGAQDSLQSTMVEFFEEAAAKLSLDFSTSTELWKDAYNSCNSRQDIKSFLRPLTVMSPYVSPQINSHIVSAKKEFTELPAYGAYKDALKGSLLSITRRLRAMRGGLPMLLLDLSEEMNSVYTTGTDDLPTLCFSAADGLMAANLCADVDIHKAAQNLVRTAFEDAETRADCFRSLLQCNPPAALRGIKDVLEGFVIAASSLIEANDASKWLVRSFSDILEVLCSDTDGLLQPGTPFSMVDQRALHRDLNTLLPAIWMLMCKSISIIFKRTPSWSRVLPHDELTPWFRDVVLFAAETVKHAELIRTAATCGAAEEQSKAMTIREMEADLALPLEEASSWFRMNDEGIVQETRDFFVAGLRAFQRGSKSVMPVAVKERMLDFVNSQIKIDDDSRRNTLLNLDELAELRALLDPTTASVALSDDDDIDDGVTIVGAALSGAMTAKNDPRGDPRIPMSATMAKSNQSPSSLEKARLKQARLSFAPVNPDAARKQPFVSKAATPLPPQPRFPAPAGAANRYQAASAKPVAPSLQNRYGKMAQLRQDFQAANKQPRTWTPAVSVRAGAASRDPNEPQAPEAKRSFSAMVPTPLTATTASEKQRGSNDMSESDSSESDVEEEKVGLAHLGEVKKSPAKMRPKFRPIQPNAVRRSAIVLEDRSALQAHREREEAERKRRLRENPNFAPLHRTILSWDYASANSVPPSSNGEGTMQYGPVHETYDSAQSYIATFEPMLLLECWADVQQAREQVCKGGGEYQFSAAKLTGRSNVDTFDLLTIALDPPLRGSSQMTFQDTDVVFIREAGAQRSRTESTFMAKVDAFKHSPKGARLTVRCCVAKDKRNLSSMMMPGVALHVGKLFSLTTLHREYEALHKLQHFDMVSDVLFARAAPPETVTSAELNTVQHNFGVNEPQAKAIVTAMKADSGFHLIQGPPGTGKTKTICSLVAHFLKTRKPPTASIRAGQSGSMFSATGAMAVKRKILLCAPSNAAVDEVARRAHQGVRMPSGEVIKPIVVRVGREEAMNVAVRNISLDSLIEGRLASITVTTRDDKQTSDPAKLSAEIRSMKDQVDLKRAEVENARLSGVPGKMIDQLEAERRNLTARRLALMEKMDVVKDKRQTVSRQKDADRRRVQQEILMHADVICATLGGAGHPTLASLPFDFETVIIDEAAQAVELDTLIPLRYGCRRCIMVGDPNQLPPTVISREAERMKYSQSLFVRLFDNPQNRSNLLSIQYRMHPSISQFPSQAFYAGKLKDGADMEQQTWKPWHGDALLQPFRLFDCRNSVEFASGRGHSLVNRAEAEIAARIYERLRQADKRESSGANRTATSGSSLEGNVGVVTMYKDQVRELKRAFRQLYGDGIENAVDFNTVDGFQGQEKDVIILSCVRSNGIGFLNDFRRINVAVTRAKSNLFIIANVDNLERNDRAGFWQTFVQTARKNGDLMSVTDETFRRPYAPGQAATSAAKQAEDAGRPRSPAAMRGPKRAAEYERDTSGSKRPRSETNAASDSWSGNGSRPRPPLQRPTPQRPTPQRPTPHRPTPQRPPPHRPTSHRPTPQRPPPEQPMTQRPTSQRPTSQRPMPDRPTPSAPPAKARGTPIAIPGQPPPRPIRPSGPPPVRTNRPQHALPARPRPPPSARPSEQAATSLFIPKRSRPAGQRKR